MKWIAIIFGVFVLAAVGLYLRTGSAMKTVDAGHSSHASAPEPYPINPTPPPPDATIPRKSP
jgi:hypothetical protein